MTKPKHPLLRKVMTKAQAKAKICRLQKQGKVIGFTNGCFDLLHLGHLHTLTLARKKCDALFVGLNSDDYLRRTKGPDRPVQDEATRSGILGALECVDGVIVFNEDTANDLIDTLRPDITAKYVPDLSHWPEGRLVRSYGGRAVILPKLGDHSTSHTLVGVRSGHLHSRCTNLTPTPFK